MPGDIGVVGSKLARFSSCMLGVVSIGENRSPLGGGKGIEGAAVQQGGGGGVRGCASLSCPYNAERQEYAPTPQIRSKDEVVLQKVFFSSQKKGVSFVSL